VPEKFVGDAKLIKKEKSENLFKKIKIWHFKLYHFISFFDFQAIHSIL